MDEILSQFGLDHTYFIMLGIFAIFFLATGVTYFGPFLKLIELRQKKLVEDKKAADELLLKAEQQMEAYKAAMLEQRTKARKDYEELLNSVKSEENAIFQQAREEAKKIQQEMQDSLNSQREHLKAELTKEVDQLAKIARERLLSTGA